MTRKDRNTTGAPLKIRHDLWKEAVKSAQSHILLGQSLQQQGTSLIETIATLDAGIEQAAKLLHQANTFIEKGVKIERDAHDKLLELHDYEPK